MDCPLATESVWIEKAKYHDAEKDYFEHLSKLLKGSLSNDKTGLTVDNSKNIITMKNEEQCQNQNQHQQQQSVKPKKTKKDKQAKQQAKLLAQINTDDILQQQHNDDNDNNSLLIKADVKQAIQKDSDNLTVNINNFVGTVDDEVKMKKKKKKKNKASPQSNENKTIENVNEKGNDNNKILSTNVTTTTINTNNINNNNNNNATKQDQDLQKDPNNKKVEIKQKTSNLRNSKDSSAGSNQNTLVSEIAKARQHIKNSLEKMDGIAALAALPGTSPGSDIGERLVALEKENADLKKILFTLKKTHEESQTQTFNKIKALEVKLELLEKQQPTAKFSGPSTSKAAIACEDNEDDGVDLFASDSEEEDAEATKIREQRLAEYAAKKSKKPTLIAKSNVILDVKPWDDETDLKQMEVEIRKIATDGLLWGASKFVPVAFGIKKLSISCVVEDEKVSIDWLTEEIEKLEDYVQSVDVAAFNKI